MSDTPSAKIISNAQQTHVLVDAAGRNLTMKSLTLLDQARIFKAVGAANAENGPYVRLATLAACVTEIDGVPYPFPNNDKAVEGAITRLGDHGLMAISVHAEREAEETRLAAEEAANLATIPLERPRL